MFSKIDKFDLVIACDARGGMGKNNALPWSLPGDVEHFRRITSSTSRPNLQNAVIMGRKTWQSIPEKNQPLPGRYNVVLSRNADCPVPAGVFVCASLDEALAHLEGKSFIDRVFVIGGAEVFRQAMLHERCGLLFLTEIKQVFDCDTFLPEHGELFELAFGAEMEPENGIEYAINVYRRKTPVSGT